MKLISQHQKRIMESCKERATEHGLNIKGETLEFIINNRDLIELEPKHGIITSYDYWVDDVFVLQGKEKNKIRPSGIYELVINSRPAISYYNSNNPDWLNIMIYYHVLAHIDFFQNNIFFKNTWNDDFVGQALADKRLIAKLRNEKGRLVDYIIEFSRGIDNLVNYYGTLTELNYPEELKFSDKIDFYFNKFLTHIVKAPQSEYLKEIKRYNKMVDTINEIEVSSHAGGEVDNQGLIDSLFLAEMKSKHPEFDSLFEKYEEEEINKPKDLLEFLMENSPFLEHKKNRWMKEVMQVVRNSSLYFQPQIRTKIANEGWASYWHRELFLTDKRIKSHEFDFALVNSKVTSLSRVGFNPYAIGMRLIQHIKEKGDRGKLSAEFRNLKDIEQRRDYNTHAGKGIEAIFNVRENYCDFTLINEFVDQDFVDKHKLFVAGSVINYEKMVKEYYVKSRNAEDYKGMLIDKLYHPPKIDFKTHKNGTLHLFHRFEGKQLVEEYIKNTMLGIEFLWGNTIRLETYRLVKNDEGIVRRIPYIYSMKGRKLEKKKLGDINEQDNNK